MSLDELPPNQALPVSIPEPLAQQADEGSDYNESDDEDFDPTKTVEAQDDEDIESEDETVSADSASRSGAPKSASRSGDDYDDDDVDDASYSKVQAGEGEGGFVRTRAQRKAEQAPGFKSAQSSSIDVDALWAEFNAPPSGGVSSSGNSTFEKPGSATKRAPLAPLQQLTPPLATRITPTNSVGESRSTRGEETITIERTFKFAGEITTERKTVLASSAEGRAYLAETRSAAASTNSSASDTTTIDSTGAQAPRRLPLRRGPVKRKVSLMEEYQAGKAKKLNTLQKSKLDWLGFVDKEGIDHDLKRHNKNGYLEKQGFLARVEQNLGKSASTHR